MAQSLTEWCHPVRRVNPKTWFFESSIPGPLGQGIYSVCDQVRCDHVAKVVKFNQFGTFKREAEYHKRASEAGIAPALEDSWGCAKTQYGVLIMEKLDLTLREFADNHSIHDDTLVLITKIAKKLVRALHAIGLSHGDLHLDNIMLKKLGRGRNDPYGDPYGDYSFSFKGKWYRMYLVDFGRSRDFQNPGVNPFTKQKYSESELIHQDYEYLKENIRLLVM